MSDFVVPRYVMAQAELIDHESYILKTEGPQAAHRVAVQLRRIADILERKQ